MCLHVPHPHALARLVRLSALPLLVLAGCGEPAAGPGDSDLVPGGDAATLAPGQVVDLLGSTDEPERLTAVVPVDGGSAEYLLALHGQSWSAPAPVYYYATAALTAASWASPRGSIPVAQRRAPAPTRAAWDEGGPVRGTRASPAHLGALPAVLQALANGAPLAAPRRARAAPAVGAIRPFSVLGDFRVAEIEGQAIYVGSRIAFWLDISSQPLASISGNDLEAIAPAYEGIVLPRMDTFFGAPSDVDGDSLVHVLLSPVVNENDGPVAYFYACDLLAPGTPGCAYSNQAELLYLTPPNAIAAPFNTPRAILETMAHETQHLVFFNTKYLQHGQYEQRENMYLQEGLAALAQDLTGYQAGNLYVAWFGLNLITSQFAAQAVLEDDGVYDYERDGGLRGGAYLLMRYFYDQAGGDRVEPDGAISDLGGVGFVRGLCNSPTTGLAALEERLAVPLEQALWDFYTALALTNRGPDHGPLSANPAWNFRPTQVDPLTGRQRGFDAYTQLAMGQMTGPATVALHEQDGELAPSGVEYLRLAPGQAGRLSVAVLGQAEARLAARLARIR